MPDYGHNLHFSGRMFSQLQQAFTHQYPEGTGYQNNLLEKDLQSSKLSHMNFKLK